MLNWIFKRYLLKDDNTVLDKVLVGNKGAFIVPKSVTKINSKAFLDCEFIEKIILHDGIIEIGDYAFQGCKRLKDIDIPKSVSKLSTNCFDGCDSKILEVSLPNSVEITYTWTNDVMVYNNNARQKYINDKANRLKALAEEERKRKEEEKKNQEELTRQLNINARKNDLHRELSSLRAFGEVTYYSIIEILSNYNYTERQIVRRSLYLLYSVSDGVNRGDVFKALYRKCLKNRILYPLNILDYIEDDVDGLKDITSQTELDVELLKIFATENNKQYKEEIFKYLYEVCDGRFDFTERCLLIEDVFSGNYVDKNNVSGALLSFENLPTLVNFPLPGNLFVINSVMGQQGNPSKFLIAIIIDLIKKQPHSTIKSKVGFSIFTRLYHQKKAHDTIQKDTHRALLNVQSGYPHF